MSKNNSLHLAKKARNDEFYTQYNDICAELKYYTAHFENKVVCCNCDDPIESNFTKYFILNFKKLKLKRLICTFYDIHNQSAYAFVYNGEDLNNDGIINGEDIEIIRKNKLFRNVLVADDGYDKNNIEDSWQKGKYGCGDFRSQHCIEYLISADIIVTNPPFSLFREYVAQLVKYNKKYIIVGNKNAITYKEIFPLIKDNKMWLGITSLGEFNQPDGSEIKKMTGLTRWFTNLEHKKRHEPISLYKEYSADKYPKYDNYDAINVDKVSEIPMDYDGVMGVPITFLHKYCPEQFEIVGIMSGAKGGCLVNGNDGRAKFYINDKGVYARILIRHKK